ncbi:hypothetical protein LIMNO130_80176 [Limnobacter sp. 130]|uniref:hypothetical protein n=1 Tax=Limnobacter sp. 130 TaxID=2653147 RepID=UPI0012F38301|nr:hypothetical protein [Limnobacter sp. 130]VWX37425.1 hypothetical protein LIMNO130_80176 [Limnobacter sp. 130]
MKKNHTDFVNLVEKIRFISEKTILSELYSLFSQTHESVSILTAFCTDDVFRLLCKSISKKPKKTLLARFRPSDVISGACDLAVIKRAIDEDFNVFINQQFHGKIYRGDHKVVIGSSNMTSNGLGLRNNNSNVEQNCLLDLDELLSSRIENILNISTPIDLKLLNLMKDRINEINLLKEDPQLIFNDLWNIKSIDETISSKTETIEYENRSLTAFSQCLWSQPNFRKTKMDNLYSHDMELLGCPTDFDINSNLDYIAYALERSTQIIWLKNLILNSKTYPREGARFGLVKEKLKALMQPNNKMERDFYSFLVNNLFSWIKHCEPSDECTLKILRPNHTEIAVFK